VFFCLSRSAEEKELGKDKSFHSNPSKDWNCFMNTYSFTFLLYYLLDEDGDQRDTVVPRGGGGWGRGVDCPNKDKSREPADRLGNLNID